MADFKGLAPPTWNGINFALSTDVAAITPQVFDAKTYGVVADCSADGVSTPGTDQTSAINAWLTAANAIRGSLAVIQPSKTGNVYRIDGVIKVPGNTNGGIEVDARGCYFRRIAAATTSGYSGAGTDPIIQFIGNSSHWLGGTFQSDKASPIGITHFGPFDPSWTSGGAGALNVLWNTFEPELISGPLAGPSLGDGSIGVRWSATYTPFGFGTYWNKLENCRISNVDVAERMENQANGSMSVNVDYYKIGTIGCDMNGGATGPLSYCRKTGGTIHSSRAIIAHRSIDRQGFVALYKTPNAPIVTNAANANSSVYLCQVDGMLGEPGALSYINATADPGIDINLVNITAHGLLPIHIGRLCTLTGGDFSGRDLSSKISSIPDADSVRITGTIRTAVTSDGTHTRFTVGAKSYTLDSTTLNNYVKIAYSIDDTGDDTGMNNMTDQFNVQKGRRDGTINATGMVLPGSQEAMDDSIRGGFLQNELTNYDLRGGTITETLNGTLTTNSGTGASTIRPGDGTTSKSISSGVSGGTCVYQFDGLNLNTYQNSRWWPFLQSRIGATGISNILVEYKANDNLWYTVINDTAPIFRGGMWANSQAAFTAPFGGAPGPAIAKGLRFTLTLVSNAIVHISEFGASNKGQPFGVYNMLHSTGINIMEGTNTKQGVSTMSGGAAVVSNTSVTATSRIFLTAQSLGTVAAPKALAVTARTPGTSFTITSSDGSDTSVVAWEIFEVG